MTFKVQDYVRLDLAKKEILIRRVLQHPHDSATRYHDDLYELGTNIDPVILRKELRDMNINTGKKRLAARRQRCSHCQPADADISDLMAM